MGRLQAFSTIDKARLARFVETHPELDSDITSSPRNGPLARGVMDACKLRDGVKVMRGRMRGLRETVVDSIAEAGLHIEARLAGVSSSHSKEGPEIKCSMRPGEGYILGLNEPVQWHVNVPAQEALEVVSVHFPHTFIEKVGDAHASLAKRILREFGGENRKTIELTPDLIQITQELLEIPANEGFGVLRMEGLALSMLAAFFDLLDGADLRPDRSAQVMPLVRELIARSAPRIWTSAALADELGLSPAKIKRAALAETGQSIGAWLATMRLDAARAMLARPLSVGDIAMATGYGSAEALSKAFHRKYGISPAAFRRKLSQSDS